MPTTTLYLVRHAEQEHAADATADDPRAGLTTAGVHQAHRLGGRLAGAARCGRHGPLPRPRRPPGCSRPTCPGPGHALRPAAGPDADPRRRRRRGRSRPLPRVPGRRPPERAGRGGAAPVGRGRGAPVTVADRDRAELLVTHTFVIGWLVRQVLDAPPGAGSGSTPPTAGSRRSPSTTTARRCSSATTTSATSGDRRWPTVLRGLTRTSRGARAACGPAPRAAPASG